MRLLSPKRVIGSPFKRKLDQNKNRLLCLLQKVKLQKSQRMKISETRREYIAEAVFDRFILEKIVDPAELAVRLNCNSYVLQQLKNKTYNKRLKTSVAHNLPPQEAEKVILAIVKYVAATICARVVDFRREFKNMAEKLNKMISLLELENDHKEPEITSEELMTFFWPFYLEAVTEAFLQD